jgi:hypothetical protein
MPAKEAELYQLLRNRHCDQRLESHECAGRLIIDRNGITLACPLCGDARKAYAKADAQPDQPNPT